MRYFRNNINEKEEEWWKETGIPHLRKHVVLGLAFMA